VFTRKTIPFIIGSILLVSIAFLFLTRALDWTYVSDLYKDKDEPAVVIVPPQQSQPDIKLEIAVSLNEQHYEELVSLSKQVNEQHPQLDITITNYYDEQLTYEQWEELARLGKLGDIQLVPNEWVVPLAIQGLYQPVDRLMSNEGLSDQLPSVIDAFRWNGYLWAVPYESNPYIVFIHRQAEGLLEKMKDNEAVLGGNALDTPIHSDGTNDEEARASEEEGGTEEAQEEVLQEANQDEDADAEATSTTPDNEVDPSEVEEEQLPATEQEHRSDPSDSAVDPADAGVTTNLKPRLSFSSNLSGAQRGSVSSILDGDQDSSGSTNVEDSGDAGRSYVLADWSFPSWLQLYEQLPSFSGALLNIDAEQSASLVVWLSLWYGAEDNYLKLGQLSDAQSDVLQYLLTNPELVQTSIEIKDDSNQPLLYLTTARQYFEQRELIEEYYLMTQTMSPLPWMNGKSFMLSGSAFSTGKNEAAILWMELINRHQPENSISHRKMSYMLSSNSMQSLLGAQFEQKLANHQLFYIDRHWIGTYTLLQRQWQKSVSLQQKVALFLEAS